MSDLPIDDDKQLNQNRRYFKANAIDKEELTIQSDDKLVEASLVDSATSIHSSQENVNESEVFVQQFDYTEYLFDPNSESFSTDPSPARNSAGVSQSLPEVLHPAPPPLSSQQEPPLSSSLPSSSSALQSTDSVLNFVLDQAQHLDHYRTESHHPQSTTTFVPSSIVGTSDNSSSNDFMLFDTSMLDTSTNFPGMSETSATSGASTANKISEYFTSSPLQQTSSTITANSMSQLNLESHHPPHPPHQPQQQQQQQQSQPQQQLSHQMHESDEFVHYRRINGNSGAHANSATPIPNDSNNNPIGEMSENLKDSMGSMLVEQSMSDSNLNSMAMNSSAQQLSQQQQNQYLSSDVGQMLDNSANANISSSAAAGGGGSHQQEPNQTLQRMQSSTTSATSTSDSNEPQDNLLNMIPSAFTCLLSDESEMQIDEHNVNIGNDSAMGRQLSRTSQHSSGQQQQQQQQQQSGGACLPVSDESNLYHSHHSSHHQSAQQQHQQHGQPPHHQQLSQLQHPAPNSVAIVQNQSNHQLNHHQQQQPHHQLNQQQIVANAQSTSTMEYGQSQLDMSNSTALVDTSSTTSSMAPLQHQQQSQMPTNDPSGSNLAASETMMSQQQHQSVTQPHAPIQSSEQTSVDLKSPSGTSFANAPGNYLLQSQYQQQPQQSDDQQHQLVNRSSATSSSPLISNSAGSSHSLHALTNTAHQRTHYMPSCDNTAANSSSNNNNNSNTNNNNNNNNNDATDAVSTAGGGGAGGTNQTAGISANNNNGSNANSANSNTANIGDNNSNNSANCSNPNSSRNNPANTNLINNNQANNKNANGINQFHNNGSAIDSISIQASSLNNHNIGYVLVKQEQSKSCQDASKQQQQQSHQNVFIKCEQQESSSVNYLGPPQSNDHNLFIKCEQPESSGMSYQDSSSKQHQNIGLMQYEAHQQQQHQSVSSAGANSNGNNGTDNSGQHAGSQQSTNRDDPTHQQQLRMVSLPNNGVPNSNKLRPAHVIDDPNAPATLPLLQQSTQQQQQAQVNLATFSSLSPKIRFTTSLSGNSSQNNLQTVSPALLFASKSSASAGGHQPHHPMQHQQPLHAPNSSSNPNVVQAMILPSNFTFNQAQPGLQSIHQNQGNILTTAGSNLQNVASKNYISHRSISEQPYPRSDIVLQPRHYAPSSMSTSLASINSPVDVHSTAPYQVSVGGSSLFTGSQFGRVQNVPASSGTSDNRQQPPIFLNSVALDNYSILSLQPASIPQSQIGHQSLSSSQHQQPNNKPPVPQKILLHSISAPDLDSANNQNISLISLNPKFAFNPNQVNQLSTLGHLQTSSQSASLSSNNAIAHSVNSNIPSGSIILSSIFQNQNNIPGTAANHINRGSVATNFAVPIPSAISDNQRASQIGLTLNPMSTFSQPQLLSNLPTSGSQVVTLATKSTKNSQQSTKTTSKSSTNVTGGNSSTSAAYSGKNSNIEPLMSGDPAKPYKCGLCDKNLASKNVYQLHLRSHSGEKPFVCNICHNRFSQKTSLTRHMRSHTGERPFPCEVCNKRFADKERIKIHMRIHTGEKPFSCQICSKKFSQKSTVKRHMSVHTGVKPFKCEVCGKGFANRGNLTAHTKTHQPQQHSNPASTNRQTMSNNNRQQQSSMSSQMPMSHPMSQQANNNNRPLISTNNPNDSSDHQSLVAGGSGANLEIAMNLNANQDNNKTNHNNNSNAPTNTASNNHNQFTSATVQQQSSTTQLPT